MSHLHYMVYKANLQSKFMPFNLKSYYNMTILWSTSFAIVP